MSTPITRDLIELLAQASRINPSISIKPGRVVRTIARAKNHFFSGKLPDGAGEFDESVNVFDLGELLAAFKLGYVGGTMSIADQAITLTSEDGNSKVVFYGCDASLITSQPPEKDLAVPSVDAAFAIQAETMLNMLKTASTLSAKHVRFMSESGVQKIKIGTFNVEGTPFSEITIGNNTQQPDFSFYVMTESFKVPADEYEVKYSKAGLVTFSAANGNLHAMAVEASVQ